MMPGNRLVKVEVGQDPTWSIRAEYEYNGLHWRVVKREATTSPLVEKVDYDAYGKARHHWPTDLDGDGDGNDAADGSVFTYAMQNSNDIQDADYRANCDFDRDGDVDGQDSSFASTQYGTSVMPALPAGKISYAGTGGADNSIGYDGYVYNWPVALYTVRFRHYSAMHGRWLERDPKSHIDSMNLYLNVLSNPNIYIDPLGTESGLQIAPAVEDGDDGGYWENWGAPAYYNHPSKRPTACQPCTMHEIEIDVFGGPNFATWFAGFFTNDERVVNTTNGMLDTIRDEIAKAEDKYGEGCFCIGRLRLTGHGMPGAISTGNDDGEITNFNDYYLHEGNADLLSEFASSFCNDGEIVLRGCSVGAGREGYDLLRALANSSGVEVKSYCALTTSLGSPLGHVSVKPGDNSIRPSGWPNGVPKSRKNF